jgi:hypothetical protein
MSWGKAALSPLAIAAYHNRLFALRLKVEEVNPPEIKKRLLNTIMRDALKATGEFWVKEFLPLHFQQGATAKYNYALVNKIYAIIKNRAKRVRPWIGRTRGDWVPAPKPVRPWVWSGYTMYELLGKAPSQFNIRPVATTAKQTVTVPLPVPHPISSEHSGELGRMTDDEFRLMHKFCFDYVLAELDKIKSIETAEFEF